VRFGALVSAAAVVAMCAGLVVAGVFAAQPAAAVDNGTLGIRPSNEANFFHLSVLPGASVAAIAVVTNRLAAPVTLDTYLVDGLASSKGEFALNSESNTPKTVGLWSKTASKSVTVDAKSELNVPFVITVPAGTPPGDYEGGLVIQSAPVAGSTTNSDKGSVRIDIVQRQGVRIYLTVPGKARVSLEAQPLKWVQADGTVTLSLEVHNDGNITLHPTATVEIARLFGTTTKLLVPKPESVPPGATVMMTTTYKANTFAEWSIARSVVLSAAGDKHGSSAIVIVSWGVIVGTSAVLILIAFVIWRIARFVRRARKAMAEVARSAKVAAALTAQNAAATPPQSQLGSHAHDH
jgi:hypothetical protein